MDEYRGTEGTRPYAGVGWYYAEYRDRISAEFATLLAAKLGWQPTDRVIDLGAGPGQLTLLVAPLVSEVVAIEPEPDMLAEGERRAAALGIDNVRFIEGSSDDLPTLRSSLGRFRTALMGQSFHWMLQKDWVISDLSAMIDETSGSIAFVRPLRVTTPEPLEHAQKIVQEILQRYLTYTPAGPHPNGRHDPFEDILARSAFPHVELFEYDYQQQIHPTLESLVGVEYTISHVLARLGDRRAAFEQEVRAALGDLSKLDGITVSMRDEALIGRR